jgi:hypothetical protein
MIPARPALPAPRSPIPGSGWSESDYRYIPGPMGEQSDWSEADLHDYAEV